MSVGTASVPTMRYGFVGSFGTVAEQVALAREVEAAGWDGYFTWDAISLGTDATWDPFALLGAVAASTERITLGALVFAVPRRSPWELARQALTVDHLSGGRLVLPMGVGVTEDRAVAGVSGRAPRRTACVSAPPSWTRPWRSSTPPPAASRSAMPGSTTRCRTC